MNVISNCKHGQLLHSTKDTYVGKSLDKYGEYSEHEAKLLCHILKPGNIAVEVGANIGALTVPMANRVGVQGMVFAFEPQRTTYYCLCGNVFINNLKNTFCFQHAVGEVPGTITVPDIDYDFEGNFGAFSVCEKTAFDVILNRVPVQIHALDEYHIAECDLLKVDVEGMELEVLKGGVELIRKNKPVLYVENDRDDKREALLRWIMDQGYECWQHFPPLYNPDNFLKNSDNCFDKQVSANLLAFHKDSKWKIKDFEGFGLVSPDIKVTIVHT